MATATQLYREFKFISPLGPDVLLFYRMHGTENLGGLFEYELDLLSSDPAIPADKILGESVDLKIELPDGSERVLNGVVCRFGQYGTLGEYAYYRATLRPWLWLLTRTTNCRIFQAMTVPDIVKKVFKDKGFSDFEEKLTRTYPTHEYCVQYRETDFNFISRLMEQEGIYYYFKHQEGSHKLIFADSPGAHQPRPGNEELPFFEHGAMQHLEKDHVFQWSFEREVQPVRYVLEDFDYTKPSADLQVRSAVSRAHKHAEYEIFDYPGTYAEVGKGEGYVNSRIQELQTRFHRISGQANTRGLETGGLFTLSGHQREDQNRQYLITSLHYQFESNEYYGTEATSGENSYRCSFTAICSDQVFGPPRVTPKPTVQGPQTAIVVGKSGEEIWTDEHGRVKVLFHWDREGKKRRNETCSCWVRVSHPWAGKGWGAVSIPRIGQEVIVDFIEGDPDQPIVTGRVYNGEIRAPFPLPGGAVVSGIKSNTHKGTGYNEISMDDTAGKEQFVIHSQYNMTTTVRNNDTQHVMVDRTTQIDGKHVKTVKKNLEVFVTEGDQRNVVQSGHLYIEAAQTITLKVGASTLTLDKDGNIFLDGVYLKLVGSSKIDLNP